MRTSCLSAAFSLVFFLVPVQLLAGLALEEDLARRSSNLKVQEAGGRQPAKSLRAAKKRLAEFDTRLRRGEGQAVYAAVQALVSELRESGGETGLLAAGLRSLALAEAGMGRRDEAVWHWQVAQNLQPDLKLDPAAYGEAGAFLAQHMLRQRDQAPAGTEVAVADLGSGTTPPRKIAGDEPVVPGFLASPGAPRWVRLQAVIDTQGRVAEPVVLAGRFEAMRWAVLEAVRSWRFEPARREGQPVAVFLEILLPSRAETPLAELMPLTGELGRVHALLLQQQWREARTQAAALVQSVAEAGVTDPRRSAASLALLALADAGLGSPSSTCYWHAAKSLYDDLYHANLDAYGAAGALLEASNPWMQDGEILLLDEHDVRPEKIPGGPAPQYTRNDRLAGVRGTVVMEIVIGEDGRVSQPRLLEGLSPGIDLMALPAVCEWRFKPATLGGKPVRVYYTLTISYMVS